MGFVTRPKPEVYLRRRGRHLEKSVWHHNLAMGGRIWMRFGWPTQNQLPLTIVRPTSKPEIEFWYVGRLLSESRTSNISDVDWDISPKSGLQIDRVTSWNRSTEVNLRRAWPPYWKTDIWRHNITIWLCSQRVTTMWVNRPLQVNQLGQLSLSSFRGR